MEPTNVEAFLAHASLIRGLARNLLVDPDATEDVVQLTWIRSMEAPPAQREGSFRRWLSTVALNLARNRLRTDRRRGEREQRAARPEAVLPADRTLDHEVIIKRLVDEVFRLDEPYRTTVSLRYYEDLSLRQIADRMQVPLETVRTRMRRAHARLRQRLDHQFGCRRDWCLALAPIAGISIAAPAAGTGAPLADAASTAPNTAAANAAAPSTATANSAATNAAATTSATIHPVALAKLGVAVTVVIICGLVVRQVTVPGPPSATTLDARDEDADARSGVDPGAVATASSTGSTVESDRDAVRPGPDGTKRATAAATLRPVASRTAAGSLHLRITFADGTPASGVRAQVDPGVAIFPAGDLMMHLTDAEGNLVLDDLAPGYWNVFVDRALGFRSCEIRDGETTDAAWTLPEGRRISGVVTDPHGVPLPGARLVFSRRDFDCGVILAHTDALGRYRIRDISQEGYLGARADGLAPTVLHHLAPYTRGERELDLQFTRPGGALAIEVTDGQGAAIDGAVVWVGERLERPYRTLDGGERVMHPPWRRNSTGADGRVRLDALASGETRVAVVTPDGPVVHRRVHATAGATTTIRIRVDDGTTMAGVVRDPEGRAVSGARLEARSIRLADMDVSRSATTDGDGRYRVDGLAPGEWVVTVTGTSAEGTARRRHVIDDHAGTIRFDPVLDPGVTMRVRVVSAEGTPVTGWHVTAMTPAADLPPGYSVLTHGYGYAYRDGQTDADGTVRIAGLANREHRIEVRSEPRFRSLPRAVVESWEPGPGVTVVRIDSDAWGRLGGRLVASDGSALGEARLFLRRDGHLGGTYFITAGDDGVFEFGPLSPDHYWLTCLDGDGFETVLGRHQVLHGETVDLGDQTIGERGSLSARLTGPDGAPPQRPILLIQDPSGSSFGGVLYDAGLASRRLAPGRYHLMVLGTTAEPVAGVRIPFEIHADEVTRIDVPLERGAPRGFRLGERPGHSWARYAELIIRADDGTIVYRRWTARGRDGRFAFPAYLAPGSYTVVARTDEPGRGEVDVNVDGYAPLDDLVDVPVR